MVRYLLLGSGSTFVVSFIALIFLARTFPLEFISDVKAVTLYGGWFTLVFSGQVHAGLLYFHDKSETPSESVRIFSLTYLIAAAISCGIMFSYIFPILYVPAVLDTWGITAFGVAVGLNLLYSVTGSVFTAHRASQKIPFFAVLYGSATLMSLLMAHLLTWDVNSYAISLAALSLIAIVLSEWRRYIMFVVRNIRRASASYYPPLGKYSAKMTFSLFLELIGDKFDKLLVSKLFSQVAFAKYSVLSFENPLVNILLGSYGISLVKSYQGGIAGREKLFLSEWERVVRRVTFLTFPVSVFLIFNHSFFILNVFGDRFLDLGRVFQIYLMVTFVRSGPFQSLLRLEGAANLNILIAILFCLSAIAVGGIVVAYGANLEMLALSYFSAWLIFNGAAAYLFGRISRVRLSNILLGHIVLSRLAQCLLAAGLSSAASGSSIYLQTLAFGLSYLLMVSYWDREIRSMVISLTRECGVRAVTFVNQILRRNRGK